VYCCSCQGNQETRPLLPNPSTVHHTELERHGDVTWRDGLKPIVQDSIYPFLLLFHPLCSITPKLLFSSDWVLGGRCSWCLPQWNCNVFQVSLWVSLGESRPESPLLLKAPKNALCVLWSKCWSYTYVSVFWFRKNRRVVWTCIPPDMQPRPHTVRVRFGCAGDLLPAFQGNTHSVCQSRCRNVRKQPRWSRFCRVREEQIC